MTSGTLHDASWLVTDRTVGASQGAFAFNNLAVHVGDDPDAVTVNRAALGRALGVPAVVFARAAHGRDVAYVEAVTADVEGVDGLFTDRTDVAIAAQGADCVMVGVCTADGWIAAVHCGWRGLVVGVVPATLRALTVAGAALQGAVAHLGPSICGKCYKVDDRRAAEVAHAAPAAVVTMGSQRGVDVRVGVLEQLRAAGVNATWDPRCTAEDPRLYSHRRDGVTGRQALAIVRRPA
ncbi:MAG: polyphenol oxidase family protein [Candidatus Nanopelagicales bacterium]